MPLSRMESTTFAMPSIIDSHDMGLRTVLTVRTPKEQRLFNYRGFYSLLRLPEKTSSREAHSLPEVTLVALSSHFR
ncbi:hypothetical protein TNCV_4502231 [Trichonephila clavipes]|nr:hypothetical protein TNCV_4502231 [Trichonephila clavipes]